MLGDIVTLAVGVTAALIARDVFTTGVTYIQYKRLRKKAQANQPDFEAILRNFEQQVEGQSEHGAGSA